MDINQQLLELHISFRANQELNGGDRAEEILGLISRLFDGALIPHSYPLMDLSLKDEMSKIVCKNDETHDNHGFDIPEELQPTFDRFKQFLKDNDAEGYWGLNRKGRNFFKEEPNPYLDWIDCAFLYCSSEKGRDFWRNIQSKWASLQ